MFPPAILRLPCRSIQEVAQLLCLPLMEFLLVEAMEGQVGSSIPWAAMLHHHVGALFVLLARASFVGVDLNSPCCRTFHCSLLGGKFDHTRAGRLSVRHMIVHA